MVLRLSDEGVACDAPMQPEALICPHGWGLDLTLRKANLTPGVFDLADYARSYALASVHREERTCVGDMVGGPIAQGQLQIYTVTEDCVVGRLIDTADNFETVDAPLEGGFVALRCGS